MKNLIRTGDVYVTTQDR